MSAEGLKPLRYNLSSRKRYARPEPGATCSAAPHDGGAFAVLRCALSLQFLTICNYSVLKTTSFSPMRGPAPKGECRGRPSGSIGQGSSEIGTA